MRGEPVKGEVNSTDIGETWAYLASNVILLWRTPWTWTNSPCLSDEERDGGDGARILGDRLEQEGVGTVEIIGGR